MSTQINTVKSNEGMNDQQNDHFAPIQTELPQKLRLLSFALKNRDFNEVGFIAHHIHQLFERLGAVDEQAMALQLTKASTMHPAEAEEKVSKFKEYLLRGSGLED
ncbi:MAG: hypothetical protein JXR10_06245 [Cyclobacteriaceae bacterium]